jgi:hypothetical protein
MKSRKSRILRFLISLFVVSFFGTIQSIEAQNGPVCDTYTTYHPTVGLGSNNVNGVYAVGSTVYAATSDGLSVSTDGATNFTNKSFSNYWRSNIVYGVFAVGSTVYAATGSGLSISTDGGANFTNKTTANGLGSNEVRCVYAVGSTVYAATTGGLSISTDGGTNFSNKITANGLGSNEVLGVYAIGSTVYAATGGGFSISTDGGANFSNKTIANGLGSNYVRGVYAIGSKVYAATLGSGINRGGLSISTDGGANFTNKTTIDGLGDNSVLGVYSDGSTVYAATVGGLSISTDGGANFSNKTTLNGLGSNEVYGVYVVGSTVYAATYSGLSISADGGANFSNKTPSNALGSYSVYGVYTVGNMVYAATYDGLSISTDGGANFSNKTTYNGLGSNVVRGVYVVGSTVYAATGGGLSISTDGGANFTNKTTANGLGWNEVRGVYAIGSTVYAATAGGLSISTDGGANFSNKTTSNGLGSDYIGGSVYGVYAVGNTIYAATSVGLSISTDGGTNFAIKTTSNGLGSNEVLGVYTVGSTVYAATVGGLSISTDGGANFTNKTTSNGLGSSVVFGVYVVGSTVYAAIDGGLSISTDGGANFTNKTTANGLGDNTVYGAYAVGSKIYAATYGGLSFCSAASTCTNPTNGGSIAAAQSGTSPFTPTAFTSSAAPSGETGTIEYKWQSSTTSNSSGFGDISSSNAATYTAGALTQTTWFKRLARVTCSADWTGAAASNVIEVMVSTASNNNVPYTWQLIIPKTSYNNNEVEFSNSFSFDVSNSKLYSWYNGTKRLYEFDLNSNSVQNINSSGYPSELYTIVYDFTNRRLIGFRQGRDNVYTLPITGGTWSQMGNGGFDHESYGSQGFWNPITNRVGIYGGYGYFSMKNWIWENNSSGWTNVYQNNNNCNPPRGGNQLASNSDGKKLYIFSGQGSCNGDQFASSCSLGSPWATDVGIYCWLKDIWELNLADYTFKNILPVNDSSVIKEGSFSYDYNSNTFFNIGGYTPSPTYNSNYGNITNFENDVYKFKPGTDSGFVKVNTTGNIPPQVIVNQYNGRTFYDANYNRIIWARNDGIWALSLPDTTQNVNNTASAPSSTPSLCINSALTNITHSTTGATGIGTATGLPTGVTAAWASNTITISGTPTVAGTFNYSIPLTGGSGNVNATGTITVTPANTVSAPSSTPTLYINTALTNITHSTTGATGIGTAIGLPTGITAAWANNIITISGTPTAAGTFNYSIPLTGGCGSVYATMSIQINPANTASGASSSPTLFTNNTLTSITHTTTGATGIGTPTGLPPGVTASWTNNTITISGTPTTSGTFTYSIPLIGGGGTVYATGTITVLAANTVSAASYSPSLCMNFPLTNITHSTTGATGIGTASGLPTGVTAAWANNTITISGTPTAAGIFNYSIPLSGGSGTGIATGTITTISCSVGTNTWIGIISNLWNNPNNWSHGTVPISTATFSITTGTPQLNVDFTVGGNMTISGTGTLTVNAGKTLSVAAGGTADFGGKSVTFKSDASGTAQLGQMLGTLSNASNVTMERYIPARRAFRFMAAPATTSTSIKQNWMENGTYTPGLGTHISGTGGASNGFDATNTNNGSLYSFSNTIQNWVTSTNTNANLSAGDAYRLFVRGDRGIDLTNNAATPSATVLRTTGTPYVGAKTYTLSSIAGDWNFIGNPYQSTIDGEQAIFSNVTPYYYAWDPKMGTRGAYVVYDFIARDNNLTGSQINKYFQPGQAFFVQTDVAGAANLTFTESAKASASNQTAVFQPTIAYPMLNATLNYTDSLAKNAPAMDGFKLLFDNSFSNSVDRNDAQKLTNQDENISINQAGTLLSIEKRQLYNAATEIAISTSNYVRQQYTVQLSWSNPIDNGFQAQLVDNYTNATTPIAHSGNTDYSYTIDNAIAASKAGDRFKIVFVPNAALPVSGIELGGTATDKQVKLSFKALNEHEMSSYAIERSADGTSFTTIGTQQPLNAAQASASYSFADNQPIVGNNYYRIKGSSINGQIQFSNVAVVKYGINMASVTVVPNPVQGKTMNLKLSQLAKGNYHISVTDAIGRTILKKEMLLDGSSLVQLGLPSSVKAGNYFVKVDGQGNTFIQTFIIQ